MWAYLTDLASKAAPVDWVFLVTGILLFFGMLGTWNYDFFSKRGLPYMKPKLPFLGNNLSSFLGFESFANFIKDLYAIGDGFSVCGFFELQKPLYMIRDPEYFKIITVKSFNHFMNRKSFTVESDTVFSKNLLALKGQRWRNMRTILSPAFTTGKIKAMFPLISQCGDQMVQHLREKYYTSQKETGVKPLETDVKEIFSRLANDVIATVVFGVQCDSLKEPENEFYQMGKKLTTFSMLRALVIFFNFICPSLIKLTGVDVVNPEASAYFEKIVMETIKEREEKGIFRPDILQLMMQARKGELKADAGDEHEVEKTGGGKDPITDTDIVAQILIFFFAGFETVSTALSYTAYALSLNLDIQKRLSEDIHEALAKEGGKLSYETIQSMKYLDMVLHESLRMYPPVMALDRECSEDIILPPMGKTPAVSFKKGDFVSFPTLAVHHDPKYWPDPEKFDPERFNDENKKNIKPFTYFPFGLGGRICIAQRFAMLEVKTTLVHLVKNFLLLPSQKAKHPMEYDTGVNNKIKGGFWCDLVPRE